MRQGAGLLPWIKESQFSEPQWATAAETPPSAQPAAPALPALAPFPSPLLVLLYRWSPRVSSFHTGDRKGCSPRPLGPSGFHLALLRPLSAGEESCCLVKADASVLALDHLPFKKGAGTSLPILHGHVPSSCL